MEALILWQRSLNPGRGAFTTPHDSTVGVGEGFYWASGCILIFIVGGVMKAFWDDRTWRGKFIRVEDKKKSNGKLSIEN